MLAVFETGVRYHFVHALGLFVAAWLSTRNPGGLVTAAGWCFLVGVVLFSGSLHVFSASGARWLGVITPFGRAAFLAGWVLVPLAAGASKYSPPTYPTYRLMEWA